MHPYFFPFLSFVWHDWSSILFFDLRFCSVNSNYSLLHEVHIFFISILILLMFRNVVISGTDFAIHLPLITLLFLLLQRMLFKWPYTCWISIDKVTNYLLCLPPSTTREDFLTLCNSYQMSYFKRWNFNFFLQTSVWYRNRVA